MLASVLDMDVCCTADSVLFYFGAITALLPPIESFPSLCHFYILILSVLRKPNKVVFVAKLLQKSFVFCFVLCLRLSFSFNI